MEQIVYKDDELQHWGIRGMKWGVRRYQNKDGSLTPAGEKRRAKLEAEVEKLGGGKKSGSNSGDSDDTKPAKKTLADMSDAELRRINERTRLEDEYRRLHPEPTPVQKPSFMKKMFSDVVAPAATNAGKRFLENALNQAGDSLLKGKVDPNSTEALTAIRDRLKLEGEIAEYRSGEKRNWDNLLKKQQYENQAADRDSKMRGYKDAADEARANRETEAVRKASQLVAKREAMERAGSDKTLNKFIDKTVGQPTPRTNLSNPLKNAIDIDAPVSSVPTKTTSAGKSYVDNAMSSGRYDRTYINSLDDD